MPTLLEMCADDAAARRHGREPLLTGLVALSGTATPANSLAAAMVGVLARAERLTAPRPQLIRARSRAVLSGAVAVIASGPLGIAALSVSGVLLCGI